MRRLILLIALAAVYVITMPISFPSGDAASEIATAMSQSSEWRASHLLTTPLYRAILHFRNDVVPMVPGFIIIQLANIIMALFSIFLFHEIAVTCFHEHPNGKTFAFWLSMILGSCNVMWVHSTTAETGIHPQLFLMVAFFLLFRYLNSNQTKVSSAILAILSLSISVLFALYIIVLIPVFLVTIVMATSKEDKKRVLVSVLITAALGCCLPFVLAALLQGVDSTAGFLGWMTFHSETVRLGSKSILSVENVLRPLAGITSAFVNTGNGLTIIKLILRKEAVYGVTIMEYVRLFLGVVMSALVFLLILRSLRAKEYFSVKLFSLAALAMAFLGNLYWLGSDPQFWLPVLPLFLILMAIGAPAGKPSPSRFTVLSVAGPLIAGALVTVNIPTVSPSVILPEGGREVRMAREFTRYLSAGDVVITPGSNWVSIVKSDSIGLRWINLVYASGLGVREEFYSKLDSIVENALDLQRQVFLDGLEGPATAAQYGNWEMFRNYRGISRAELKAHLMNRFDVRLFSDFPRDTILIVKGRKIESQVMHDIPIGSIK